MSEYCFEYTCHAKGVENKKSGSQSGKDLQFLLFQDYEKNGELCVQVVIPQLPMGYEGIKLCHIEYSIDVPRVLDKALFDSCGGKYFSQLELAQYGGFLIRGGAKVGETLLSGTGIFGFVKDRNAEPLPQDCFVYTINFSEKQEIVYRIRERKKKIEVELQYPLLRNDIVLQVVSQPGSKPLDTDAYGKTFLEEQIVLKAGMKSYHHQAIAAPDIHKSDFRLFFADPADARHYLLVDESEETLEERTEKRGNRIQRTHRYVDDFGKTEVKTCPYCFEPLVAPQYEGKGTVSECCWSAVHAVPSDSPLKEDIRDEHLICCGNDYRKSEGEEDSGFMSYDLYKHLILPSDYMRKPSMNVTVIGETNAGKSVLLSTILGARSYSQEQAVEGEGDSAATSYLLKCIVPRFTSIKKAGVRVFPLHRLRVKGEKADEFTSINSEVLSRVSLDDTSIEKENAATVAQYYTVSVGKPLPSQTKSTDIYKRGLHPFAFQLGDLGYSFFYDVPGEVTDPTNQDLKKLRAAKHADCLVTVINGYNPEKIKDSVMGPKGLNGILFGSMAKLLGEEKLFNTPVAICLAKFDLLNGVFDENCHIQRTNMLKLMSGNKQYEGSEIERHINCSSYEIEHYLASSGCGEFVRELERFQYCKFFAVSALGSDDCVKVESQSGRTIRTLAYHERPLRLELPLVWLMYQRGLIKK